MPDATDGLRAAADRLRRWDATADTREKHLIYRDVIRAGDPLVQLNTAHQRDMRAVVAAYLAHHPEGGPWLDVSAAPKDGDLVADVWAYCSARGGGRRHADATRRDGVWYDCGGNVLNWGRLDTDGEPHYRKVTYWMPLPEPPKPDAPTPEAPDA